MLTILECAHEILVSSRDSGKHMNKHFFDAHTHNWAETWWYLHLNLLYSICYSFTISLVEPWKEGWIDYLPPSSTQWSHQGIAYLVRWRLWVLWNSYFWLKKKSIYFWLFVLSRKCSIVNVLFLRLEGWYMKFQFL